MYVYSCKSGRMYRKILLFKDVITCCMKSAWGTLCICALAKKKKKIKNVLTSQVSSKHNSIPLLDMTSVVF